jgi:hypothetical protein
MMDETLRAVLVAADGWLTAIEAITAADEAEDPHRSEGQEDDFDDAEIALATAVKAWRIAGRPV